MELETRFLQLCNFEPLGENSPTKLLLNTHFSGDKQGGLVILVGENNVGKSRVLEALKTFNDVDIKLCNEKDYFKPYTLKDTILSLEEETSVDNKITDFSCVDIRCEKNNENLKKIAFCPFNKHVKASELQLKTDYYSPYNISSVIDSNYLNICTFIGYFIDLIVSCNQLKSFIDFYKEKLKLSEFVTTHAGVTNHLLFKELVKNLSGDKEFTKNFCRCIREIIKCNTPNKKCERNKFYLFQESKQNKLQEISMKLQKIFDNPKKHPNEITRELKNIIKTLNIEVFGNNFDKLFGSKILELKDDYQKEKCEKLIDKIKQAIENQYPINKDFTKQFNQFRGSVCDLKIKERGEKFEQTKAKFEKDKENFLLEVEYFLKHNELYCRNIAIRHIEEFLNQSYKITHNTLKDFIISYIVDDKKENSYNEFYSMTLDCFNEICKEMMQDFQISKQKERIKELVDKFYDKNFKIRENNISENLMYDNKESAYNQFWSMIWDCFNEVCRAAIGKECIFTTTEIKEPNFLKKIFYCLKNSFNKTHDEEQTKLNDNKENPFSSITLTWQQYKYFKENVKKSKSIVEVVKCCKEFDKTWGLEFVREKSKLFMPSAEKYSIKGTPTQQAIQKNYLPQIIYCDNSFELSDKDLCIEIIPNEGSTQQLNSFFQILFHNPLGYAFNKAHTAIYDFICFKSYIENVNKGNYLEPFNKKFYFEIEIKQDLSVELKIFHEIYKDDFVLSVISKNNNITLKKYMGVHKILYLNKIESLSSKDNQEYKFQTEIITNDKSSFKVSFKIYDLNGIEFFVIETDILQALQNFLQPLIDKNLTHWFNEMYAKSEYSNNRYEFKIKLTPKDKQCSLELEIYDIMKQKLELTKQSTGFLWFFNFFFNFVYRYRYYTQNCNKILSEGDIILIDEPATNLSVPVRQNFRNELKKFGKERGLTFILATHDPFLVDTDHLDEIRIVEKMKQGSVIYNEFNYSLNNASRNSDALDKIKRSLGVGQHVFHNPMEHQIIFVEGITDYCYLTAFKIYFNKLDDNELEKELTNTEPSNFKEKLRNITFLPISGLKDNPKAMQETIKALQKLDSNPVVLIDDDRKSGVDPQKANSEKFKQANKELGYPIKILQLSQCICPRCNKNFKQIEDLFSVCDKERYAKNKRMELAMAFKTKLLYGGQDVVGKQTESNFLKLFEWITWIVSLIKN